MAAPPSWSPQIVSGPTLSVSEPCVALSLLLYLFPWVLPVSPLEQKREKNAHTDKEQNRMRRGKIKGESDGERDSESDKNAEIEAKWVRKQRD